MENATDANVVKMFCNLLDLLFSFDFVFYLCFIIILQFAWSGGMLDYSSIQCFVGLRLQVMITF